MTTEVIKKIDTQIVDLPLKRVHKFSATSINTKSFLLVRIYSDNGMMGIGEATTPGGPWWAGEAIESIKVIIDDYFAPVLIGQNALQITSLMKKLDAVAANNNFAKAAVEMSLFDLKGKALSLPVYEFFGGLHRSSSVISWPLAMGDAVADIEEAEAMMEKDLARNFKVKMGYKSAEDDLKYVGELCKGLSHKAGIRGDLNQAWTETQAKLYLPGLVEHGMSLIEQPVQGWNRAGMARIRNAIPIPLLADESVQTRQDGLDLVKLAAADAISLKPLKSGGLLATQEIAAIANAAGVDCYAGTFLESSIGTASFMHLVAASPHIDFGNELVGPIWLADDLVQEPVAYHDEQVWLPEGHGLGVSLDESKVKHYARK